MLRALLLIQYYQWKFEVNQDVLLEFLQRSFLFKLVTNPHDCNTSRYGYSKEKKSCVEFIYGGCSGNGNNFETLEECKKACP
ncbi:hypothetical protein Q1695_005893 [Nippostrongylus brasiliensis]|nr:hypothetical protein Q1695_005893 [Nippostrongylus brasiliensis]